MSVNISAVQFRMTDMSATDGNLNAERTQSGDLDQGVVENGGSFQDAADLLRAADLALYAVKANVDDFGTGYSSLTYRTTPSIA